MFTQWILAGLTVLVVGARPRSWLCTSVACIPAAVAAALDGGASVAPALSVVWPMLAFLALGMGATALAGRAGLAAWAVERLASAGGGSSWRLFCLVSTASVGLTAVVSLDGAVVLMTPVIVELRRRFDAPFRPLLLAVVALANASSVAVPEGNPTNLVVLRGLDVPLDVAAAQMILPGLAATVICLGLVAWSNRRALACRYRPVPASGGGVPQVRTGLLAAGRSGLQVAAILVPLLPLGPFPQGATGTLPQLLLVALTCGGLAALVNNLPASAIVATSLVPGPGALAALVGLSVGALATPHGSVATLVAGDLADAPAGGRTLVRAAVLGTVAATVVLWARVVA
jgi:Na+/H+ antiporter NhaD/arsenite permease-like protein